MSELASNREAELLRQQIVLAQFGELALRSDDLDEILHEACRLVSEALDIDLAKVMELQDDGVTLRVRAGIGWPPGIVGKTTVDIDEDSSEGHALHTGQPVISANIDDETRFKYPQFIIDAGVKALVNVNIIGPDGHPPYGILQVDSRCPRDFTEHDISFLRSYANLLAAAVERLRIAVEAARVQTALGESESRYRAIVETPTDYAIITLDLEGRIASWNQGARAILGWEEAEVLGRSTELIFVPEDRAAGAPEVEMRTALADGLVEAERWHVKRDGTRFWGSSQLTPLRDGHLYGYLKFLRDHTERRLAAERLRASEERFRSAFEIDTVGVIFLDRDGRFSQVNDAFLTMCGFTREELHAGHLTWQSLTPPEWMERSRQAFDELWAVGRTTPYEKEYFRKDGSRWWGLFAAQRLCDNESVEFILDITEQREAEAQLRQSEERFRTLAEGIPQLVWRCRSSGERTWSGPQWIAYSGLSEQESLDLGWLDAVHPDDRAGTMAAWADAKMSGVFAADYRLRRAADNQYRWFSSRATPVRDAAGHIVEWFGAATDFDDQVKAREVLARGSEELERLVAARTADLARALDALRDEAKERGYAEEALRQSQKMEAVGRLTGGIAHDFNNMLQGIAGGVEMARRRLEAGRATDSLNFLDITRAAVDRAAALTHRLLAFARRQRLHPQPVDPDGLIAGMAELIRRTMGPGVRVELNLRDGAWGVLCDPNELESALLNLCINAHDAMPEGGRLAISTSDLFLSEIEVAGQEEAASGDYVAISVVDTGEGMTQDVMAQVFEPFFTTKPLGQGTGLGLSQVYGFVRQSGGVVQLESTPGHGTTVRLCMPRHGQAEAVAEPVPSPAPEEARAGETVLLVDDEKGVREPASEHLRDLGYQVVEAEDGPTALRLLGNIERLDLLVTDVGLPNGMNGRQVAEAARQRRPGLPVLFITGYSGSALPLGTEIIRKPFVLDSLARRIQSILAAKP